jgi:hypothetical protein
MHLTILTFFSETIQTGCQQPLLLTSILPPPPPPHRQPGKGNKISKGVFILSKVHTASFWNITIQWSPHDDLTENSVPLVFLAKTCQMTKTLICTLRFDRKTASIKFHWRAQIFKSIWRPNAWMNSVQFFLFITLDFVLLSAG